MPMRTHELHPTLIHAPLVLLPASAAVEAWAATTPSRRKRRLLDAVGRRLWWGTVGSGLLAGAAGMAAAREVSPEDPIVQHAMWAHGMGNFTLVLAALGVATWRSGHRASAATAMLGAGAVAASIYTAWLGGSLVYSHGAGVKGAGGVADAPALLSREAPARLLKDAAAGFGWLLRHGVDVLRGRAGVGARAIAPGSEQVSGDPGSPTAAQRGGATTPALH
jgi:uncharacterized membrane protein